jgi:hypothetical protein
MQDIRYNPKYTFKCTIYKCLLCSNSANVSVLVLGDFRIRVCAFEMIQLKEAPETVISLHKKGACRSKNGSEIEKEA